MEYMVIRNNEKYFFVHKKNEQENEKYNIVFNNEQTTSNEDPEGEE